jgi:uncharacterized protein affecting Mg2+/Co2+ transport
MPIYKVELPSGVPGLTLRNGTNALFVTAQDATDAAALVQGHMPVTDDAMWANAVVTEVTVGSDLSPVVNPDTGETLSYVATIAISGGTVNGTFTHTAAAGETISDVMDALVVLLNADANIAGAAWSSPTLTIAAIGDNIGDHAVVESFTYGGVEIPSLFGAVTDEGIAGAALSVAVSTGVVAPVIVHASLA